MISRKFNLLFQDIVLIGCGGTGSRTVPLLVQLLKNAPRAISPALYLVDGDVVEEKNLERQNFIQPDITQNKAVVLANRYSQGLDFPILGIPEMVDIDMDGMINNAARAASFRALGGMRRLYILCVDSIEARLNIMRQIPPGSVIIEAGNEDTYGNVSIFDTLDMTSINGNIRRRFQPFTGDVELPQVPAPISTYYNAMRNPSVRTGSCADNDQSAAVNGMMAAGINGMVQNLMYDIPFTFRTKYYDLAGSDRTEVFNVHTLNEMFGEGGNEDPAIWRGVSGNSLKSRLDRAMEGTALIPEALLAAIS